MTVAIYRAEWSVEMARVHTPLYHQVCEKYPDLFDYDATFDSIIRDPYVDVLVTPSVYLAPTVIVTEGGKETHLRLEASPASPRLPSPLDVAAVLSRRREIEQ